MADYSTNISKKFCQNTAIKASFHFSHYKSMEILSSYSIQKHKQRQRLSRG